MTSATFVPLISADTEDREALGTAIAARITHLPHRPRLLGFGETMHFEDEFLLLRNAMFAALVDQADYTRITLESCAWRGRIVDAYVRGGDGVEDDVMATGFSHEFGGFHANRLLVRWMREQNRARPPARHLRFAGFDAPTELMWGPSPRPQLEALHIFLSTHVTGAADLPSWDLIDGQLGAEEPWRDEAAAMDATRSVGDEPRVHHLRAITDDLRRTLEGELPRLRREVDADALEDALLAGRTAAGLLAYHGAMAHDTGDRWARGASVRDTLMADNLTALAGRAPTFVFAHNAHLRTGTIEMSLGPMTLHWQAAGAHLASRLGHDYHVIGSALGEAVHLEIPEPAPDTLEGVLHRGLPPGNHLLSAPELRPLQQGLAVRVSTNYRYVPMDATLVDEVDQLLFLRSISPA